MLGMVTVLIYLVVYDTTEPFVISILLSGGPGRDWEKAQDMSNNVSWAVGASFLKKLLFLLF